MYKSTNERKNIYKTVKRDDMMRAFSLVGSPDYMAPEVLMNDESGYDLSVDYWSLGCILYEMLSGKKKREDFSSYSTLIFLLLRLSSFHCRYQ